MNKLMYGLWAHLLYCLADIRGEAGDGDGGDGDGGDGGDGDGDKGDETFEFTDPVTKKTHKLPVQYKELIGHAISKTRNEAKAAVEKRFNPLKDELDKLRSQNSELDTKMRELEEANMTADEKAKAQFERDRKKWETDFESEKKRADEGWNSFYAHKRENDIMRALGKHDLCNAAQTAALLSTMGNAKIVKNEETGAYETRLTLKFPTDGGGFEEQELSPQEAADKWLALEENAHHLRNNLRSGGGSSNKGGKRNADGTITYTREDLKDPAKRKEYLENAKKGLAHITE